MWLMASITCHVGCMLLIFNKLQKLISVANLLWTVIDLWARKGCIVGSHSNNVYIMFNVTNFVYFADNTNFWKKMHSFTYRFIVRWYLDSVHSFNRIVLTFVIYFKFGVKLEQKRKRKKNWICKSQIVLCGGVKNYSFAFCYIKKKKKTFKCLVKT